MWTRLSLFLDWKIGKDLSFNLPSLLFEKRLFLSMLQAYFEGRKEFFKVLAIDKVKKKYNSIYWQLAFFCLT